MAETMILWTVDEKTGVTVNDGDTVTSHRGESATFVMATRARVPGKSGKVLIKGLRGDPDSQWEYYDKAFGLKVSGLLSCGCPHAIVWNKGHQVGCSERETAD